MEDYTSYAPLKQSVVKPAYTKQTRLDNIEKRLTDLEQLHIYGFWIALIVGAGYLIYKKK
jgi:hypothetical protein